MKNEKFALGISFEFGSALKSQLRSDVKNIYFENKMLLLMKLYKDFYKSYCSFAYKTIFFLIMKATISQNI